jgi:hypothetical protein
VIGRVYGALDIERRTARIQRFWLIALDVGRVFNRGGKDAYLPVGRLLSKLLALLMYPAYW